MHVVRIDPIDPVILEPPAMRRVLAARDISAVFRALADAGITQRRIAELTAMGQSEVSEVLGGRRVMAYDVLVRIANGLGVPPGWMGLAYDERTHYAYAGGVPVADPWEWVDEDMRCRDFLAAASMALWGHPVLGELLELPSRPETPTPLPSRLGAADVDAIRALTDKMRLLARQYGGQAETVSAVANRSMQLASVPAAEPVRRSLGSALAELHTEAGFCCYDSGMREQAEHYFRRALDLGAQAGDGYQVAYALRNAGIAFSEWGHPNDALKLFQMGQVRIPAAAGDDRAPALNAWLHGESAVAHARMGNPGGARSELDRARDGWEPPSAFDRADMDFLAAWVMVRLGNLDVADSLLASSLRCWSQSSDRRDTVKAEISLAALHVETGERDGLPLAQQAIRNVAELQSVRARDRLAPLADALAARPGTEARELAEHARRVAAAR